MTESDLPVAEFGVEVYFEAHSLLGEGPVWDPRTDELHWVDVKRGEVHRREHGSGLHRWVTLGQSVGSAVPVRAGDAWIVGRRDGVAVVDNEGKVVYSRGVDEGRTSHRMNDGACDSRGRFWTGTLNEADGPPSDALYRVSPDLTVHVMLKGIGLSNGLAWTPDDRGMYRVDSAIGTIFLTAFSPLSGDLGEQEVFVVIDPFDGIPDGIAVDAAGFLWVALWDGWALRRYSPTGALDLVLPLPVARPTSCTFGGAHYERLFITTATTGLSKRALSVQPLAGHILSCVPRVPGLPSNLFG